MAAKKASEAAKQEDGRYKHTVDLPKTAFGMRANSTSREPEIQKLWNDNQVFKRVVDRIMGEISFFMMALHMLMVIYTWVML
ncbi:Isoleucine--tRNA ligase, chloroplastic/mitochondrial [Vitis vinifera]|uniref:Isoleucine--tRNA ligase, chloroplastic/mitochondrial n=1 Tax=Vitis vinifera TaxID=29760 RepID=A0A438F7Y2_VITVI|nr:Isoleucine--tRNA ligase, chloroplastic/mitochondrial [Vitis vinifera]